MSRSEDERVIELAEEASKFFKTNTKESSWREGIVVLSDDAPEWLKDLCREAHGDMMPDDWKYEFIDQSIDAISNGSPGHLDEPEIEPDMYNHELLQWLSSNLNRAGYVDEALEEYGVEGLGDQGIMGAIGLGQIREKEEVYHAVLSGLRDVEDEDEEDDDDEEDDED